MKKILLLSDSFKGTLSSKNICETSTKLVKDLYNDKIILDAYPIADGGEGSLEAFKNYICGNYININSIDSEKTILNTYYLFNDFTKVAFIDSSKIIGLENIKNKVSPLNRTSYGLGEAIKDALNKGSKKIYISLGGSSTNDGGVGLLTSLGIKFFNKNNELTTNVLDLADFDLSSMINLKDIEIVCLCDVNNKFIGNNGASKVFAKQKGYSDKEIELLEESMIRFNNLIKNKLNVDLSLIEKSGAAGGISGALYAFLNAKLISGIDTILDLIDFKNIQDKYDYIITGEGCFDNQSLNGKVVGEIYNYLKDKEKLIILCGKSLINDDRFKVYETSKGINDFNYMKDNAQILYKSKLNDILSNLIL